MSHVSDVRTDRSYYLTLFGSCSRPVETGPSESRQHGALVIGESGFFLLQRIAGEEVVIEIIRENFVPSPGQENVCSRCAYNFSVKRKNNKQTIKQKTNKQTNKQTRKKLNNEGESKAEVGEAKNQTQEEVEVNEVTREVIEAARFLLIK